MHIHTSYTREILGTCRFRTILLRNPGTRCTPGVPKRVARAINLRARKSLSKLSAELAETAVVVVTHLLAATFDLKRAGIIRVTVLPTGLHSCDSQKQHSDWDQ